MRFTEIISENKKPGLWANIHAKRDRIKNGSGEHMRKPGSKGAPTADALRKSATDEAANPAQQAAIAINMKKHHQKPKGVAEGPLNEFAPHDHNKGDDDDNNGDRKKIEKMFYEVKIGEEFQLVKHYETFGVKIDDYTAHFYEEDMGEVGEDYGIERVSWDEPVRADWYFMEGENWSKHNNKRAGGMSKKSVSVYRREHPGSKIQTAVTTKPSKLKKGSKDAKRRKSFCARMRGMKKHNTSAKTARDPNSNINKSLRRWHCESIEELQELVMLAEQFIQRNRK